MLKFEEAESSPDKRVFLLDFESLATNHQSANSRIVPSTYLCVVILSKWKVPGLFVGLTRVFVSIVAHEDVLVDLGIPQELVLKHTRVDFEGL